MRTFKVIALSVSGKGKKIYSAGDVIGEDGFPIGSIDSLTSGGYIEEIKVEKKAKVSENEDPTSESNIESEIAEKPKGKGKGK